jgi:hypothetical protein
VVHFEIIGNDPGLNRTPTGPVEPGKRPLDAARRRARRTGNESARVA